MGLFSSHWFSKLGAALGSALAILPILDVIPGAGPLLKVASTVIGVGITLVTRFSKVVSATPPPPDPFQS